MNDDAEISIIDLENSSSFSDGIGQRLLHVPGRCYCLTAQEDEALEIILVIFL